MGKEADSSLSDYDLIANIAEEERETLFGLIGRPGVDDLRFLWEHRARPGQLPPPGDWGTWLVLAGRGFGKTRAGAEWVRAIAERDGSARIALIGASLHDARSVMVEGESGVLAIAPHWLRPAWKPFLRQLHWPNGATATLFGAADPETLRGPQHSHVGRAGAKGSHAQRGPAGARHARPAGRVVSRRLHAANVTVRRRVLDSRSFRSW